MKFRPLDWSPRKANFAHMTVWVSLFAVMLGTGFVGGRHPGASPEFWRRACEEGRRNACTTWVRTMNVACQHQSGRACMTLGLVLSEGRLVPRDLSDAGKDFGAACDLGIRDACLNLVALVRQEGPDMFRQPCDKGDGESCFILASLHYGGQGVPRDDARAVALFRQSCASGWWRGCGGLAECYRAGRGTAADNGQAIEYFEKACRAAALRRAASRSPPCIAARRMKLSPSSDSGRPASSAAGTRKPAPLTSGRGRRRSRGALGRSVPR